MDESLSEIAFEEEKKTRSRKGGGRDLTELTEKIGRLMAENRRPLASGKLGSRAWWRKVDRPTVYA